MERSLEVPQKTKNRVAIWSSNPTPGRISRENRNSKIYMNSCVYNSTKIARTWKQPKCPSTDEWIKKMWYTYTTEYYSTTKKKEIMPFAATWMDLEIITLNEVSQRKTNTKWYHLYVESKIWHKWTYLWSGNRLIDLESRPCGCQGEGCWGKDGVGVWG